MEAIRTRRRRILGVLAISPETSPTSLDMRHLPDRLDHLDNEARLAADGSPCRGARSENNGLRLSVAIARDGRGSGGGNAVRVESDHVL